MEEKINAMIDRINEYIQFAVNDYKENGASAWNDQQRIRIFGMIEMLNIATGKEYMLTEGGVIERALYRAPRA